MEKTISLGEINSYIKVVSRQMEAQGSSPSQILQMVDSVNAQFGIKLPKFAKAEQGHKMCLKL